MEDLPAEGLEEEDGGRRAAKHEAHFRRIYYLNLILNLSLKDEVKVDVTSQ